MAKAKTMPPASVEVEFIKDGKLNKADVKAGTKRKVSPRVKLQLQKDGLVAEDKAVESK